MASKSAVNEEKMTSEGLISEEQNELNAENTLDAVEQTGQTQATQSDPIKSLDNILDLLSKGNDTSRFVGLALLKSVLDNKHELRKDPEVIQRCWHAIPANFLDRLLKAGESQKKSKDEAQAMVQLAVAVIHTFASLLPPESRDNEKLAERSSGLLRALQIGSPEVTTQILQTLLTIGSTSKGSMALLHSSGWEDLIKFGSKDPLALDVVKYTFFSAALEIEGGLSLQEKLDAAISTLIDSFQDATSLSALFECLNDVLKSVSTVKVQESLSQPIPPWLKHLTRLLLNTTTNRLSADPKERQSTTMLAATLLQLYPSHLPALLFSPNKAHHASNDSKSNRYLFIKLLLVDIRSSIPSLLESLNSSIYLTTSSRLAACHDLTSTFIGLLVQALESEEDDFLASEKDMFCQPVLFPPDILLRLRVDISEALSLTIEYLRDRYDASVAGAAGLHPSARSHLDPSSSSTPLPITWESAKGRMDTDPLTLAQTRTLALWLREDDNKALRKEAAGIMDVFLALYNCSQSASASGGQEELLDFKSPVLIALEGVMVTSEGVEAFLGNEGWEVLVKDLQSLLRSREEKQWTRGMGIVRVLQAVADSEEVGPAREEWMDLVELAAALRAEENGSPLDLKISIAFLATDLAVRLPKGVVRRWKDVVKKVLNLTKGLTKRKDAIDKETRADLEGAVEDLGSLSLG
ncbi:MAG: hypothetical protein Q9167_001199 [Letrouitia subvulpina]